MISRDCLIQQYGDLVENDVIRFKQILSDHSCEVESNKNGLMFNEILDGMSIDILLIKNEPEDSIDITFIFNGFHFFMTFKTSDCWNLEFVSKYKNQLRIYWNASMKSPNSAIMKSSTKIAEYIKNFMFNENDGYSHLLQLWKSLDKPDCCLIEGTIIGGANSPEDVEIPFSAIEYGLGHKIAVSSVFIKKNLSTDSDILTQFRESQQIAEIFDFERVPQWKLASKFQSLTEREVKQIWQNDKELFVQKYNFSELAPVTESLTKFKYTNKSSIFILSPCAFAVNKINIPIKFAQMPITYSNLANITDVVDQFRIDTYQIVDPFDSRSIINYVYTSSQIDSERYTEKLKELLEIIEKAADKNEQ